jgi:hypothetical protein
MWPFKEKTPSEPKHETPKREAVRPTIWFSLDGKALHIVIHNVTVEIGDGFLQTTLPDASLDVFVGQINNGIHFSMFNMRETRPTQTSDEIPF